MSNKKARERFFLNEAATLYPHFPSGEITDSEQPDFLVSSNAHVVGIEVVDYVRGQKPGGSIHRRNEELWQQIADAARKEFEQTHSEPLLVHFLWHSHRSPDKASVQSLAVNAATVIIQFIPQSLFESVRIEFDDLESSPISTFVSSIHVTRVRNNQQVLWSSITAGFISVTVDEIQTLITSKNKKVLKYLEQCNEAWLLIVADGFHISSNVSISEEVKQKVYNSPFAKALLYDRLNNQVIELNLQK